MRTCSGSGRVHASAAGRVKADLCDRAGLPGAGTGLRRTFPAGAAKRGEHTQPDLSGTSLQSPDDLEATYRKKTGQRLPWLCCQPSRKQRPREPIAVDHQVQVASNDVTTATAGGSPARSEERTELATIYTDGGHGGPDSDVVLQQQKGRTYSDATATYSLILTSCTWPISPSVNPDNQPVKVTCPHGRPSQPIQQPEESLRRPLRCGVCSTCRW